MAGLVEEEIRRLERLVNDFLSFARPRPLEQQPTALAELCQSVIALMEPEARAAGVTLQLDVASGLPAVQLDPERLRQVLQNLLRNAIEAMPGAVGPPSACAGRPTIKPQRNLVRWPANGHRDRRRGHRPGLQRGDAGVRRVLHHQAEGHRPGPFDRAPDRQRPRRYVAGALTTRGDVLHDLPAGGCRQLNQRGAVEQRIRTRSPP